MDEKNRKNNDGIEEAEIITFEDEETEEHASLDLVESDWSDDEKADIYGYEEDSAERSEDRQAAEDKQQNDDLGIKAKKILLAFLDDGHGLWTAGKRTPFIPELGREIKENEFNSAVVDIISSKLKPLGIVPILVAPTDNDTSLAARTNFANKTLKEYQNKYGASMVQAVYVSIHYDAISHTWSSAQGITIFVYTGDKKNNSGRLANNIGEYLKQGTSQQYRGVKEANFHVLRESNMPAVLTENGFMSHQTEARLMVNKAFQNEVATEHTKGIAKYFNVAFKDSGTSPAPSTPSTPPAAGTPSTYTIQKGDTFSSVAKKYSLPVDVLTKANPGVDPKKLQIGQKINLGLMSYIIKKGDTFTSIAKKYGINIEAMKKANPSVDPTKLQIGQVVTVPSGAAATVSPKPAPAKPVARTINGIKIVGDIKIVNVANAAYICDRPSSSNSKNLATAKKGTTLPIAGSVPGWWEVVYDGKRAYVNENYGTRV